MDINLNVNLKIGLSDEPPAWAVEQNSLLVQLMDMVGLVIQKTGTIIRKENQIMSAQTDALDQAEAAAAANSSADDSAEALLVALSAMVADLANNQTDPATTTRINSLASSLSSRAGQLAAAVVANTPVVPEPPPTV